jgi:hypothetical protein
MSIMIHQYKGKGLYVNMDSAYMDDIMTQIDREVWSMNMAGTVQMNQLGAEMAATVKKMKIVSYKTVDWQHNNKPLVFAALEDINIVKTLSNCHGPEILLPGDRMSTVVPCSVQMKY